MRVGFTTTPSTVSTPRPTGQGGTSPTTPVLREENKALYCRYLEGIKGLKGFYSTGRFGGYRYYNMDQVVAWTLNLFEEVVLDE